MVLYFQQKDYSDVSDRSWRMFDESKDDSSTQRANLKDIKTYTIPKLAEVKQNVLNDISNEKVMTSNRPELSKIKSEKNDLALVRILNFIGLNLS